MMKQQLMFRCRSCGKLYPRHLPFECGKCHVLLLDSQNCPNSGAELVVAKRKHGFWGKWVFVRKAETPTITKQMAQEYQDMCDEIAGKQ